MKHLDQKLINPRPDTQADNERFVQQTLEAAKRAHSHETFVKLTRTKGVNNKENFMTKLLALPKLALVALGTGAVIATGGAAYAAFNWFGTDVSTGQKDGKVYSIAVNCSPSTVQALQNQDTHTNTSEYRVLKPELISEQDFKNDELATCEQRAIESQVRQAVPDIYQAGDSHNGLYFPVGTYGTVVSVAGNTVTVADIPAGHDFRSREHLTATLRIDTQTLVTDKGQQVEIAAFQPGDQVYFIFQNPVRPGQDDRGWRATPSPESTIRGFAKTQYGHRAIKEKLQRAATEDAFRVEKKSDSFGG